MRKTILLLALSCSLSVAHANSDMRSTLQASENAICQDNAKKEQCITAVQKLMFAVSKVTELNENCKKPNGNVGIEQQCQQSEEAIGYINSLVNKP